jgi:hypothetical protein
MLARHISVALLLVSFHLGILPRESAAAKIPPDLLKQLNLYFDSLQNSLNSSLPPLPSGITSPNLTLSVDGEATPDCVNKTVELTLHITIKATSAGVSGKGSTNTKVTLSAAGASGSIGGSVNVKFNPPFPLPPFTIGVPLPGLSIALPAFSDLNQLLEELCDGTTPPPPPDQNHHCHCCCCCYC